MKITIKIIDFGLEFEKTFYDVANYSLKELAEEAIKSKKLDASDSSLIFSDLNEVLCNCSKVCFLDDTPFKNYENLKLSYIMDIFDFEDTLFTVGVYGIGGEIHKENGIKFYIYSNDHKPIYIYCISENVKCKYIIKDEKFKYITKKEFKGNKEKLIKKYAKDNYDMILKKWNELNPDLQ